MDKIELDKKSRDFQEIKHLIKDVHLNEIISAELFIELIDKLFAIVKENDSLREENKVLRQNNAKAISLLQANLLIKNNESKP